MCKSLGFILIKSLLVILHHTSSVHVSQGEYQLQNKTQTQQQSHAEYMYISKKKCLPTNPPPLFHLSPRPAVVHELRDQKYYQTSKPTSDAPSHLSCTCIPRGVHVSITKQNTNTTTLSCCECPKGNAFRPTNLLYSTCHRAQQLYMNSEVKIIILHVPIPASQLLTPI